MKRSAPPRDVWVVTRRFHYDGMDDAGTSLLAVFTTLDAAEAFCRVEDLGWTSIAFPCEVERLTLDAGHTPADLADLAERLADDDEPDPEGRIAAAVRVGA